MGLTLTLLGIDGLTQNIITGWIGPVFLLLVAAIAVKFVISRQFRELGIFIALAAVVALLIFAGPLLFGPGGILTNVAKEGATQINAIMLR